MSPNPHAAQVSSSARYHDISRILPLSDGVFAMAITLLFFEIKVPIPPAGETFTETGLAVALIALWPKLLTYIATFVIIGIYWMGYQAVMRHILHYDRTFLWLNIFFLSCISFMPFPTSLLGNFTTMQVAVVAYGFSMVMTGAALSLLWRYATHDHKLVTPTLSPKVIKLGHQRILMAPIAATVSILVSSISVKLSLWIYLLAGIAYFLPSRIDRH